MSRSKPSFKHLIVQTRNYPLIAVALVSALLVAGGQQWVTSILGGTINAALEEGVGGTARKLLLLGLGIGVLAMLYWLANYLFGIYANRSMYQIRRKTMGCLQEIPMTAYSKYTTGDLISRMNNDHSLLEHFYRDVLQDTLLKSCIGLSAAVYGFFINWQVSAVIVTAALLMTVFKYSYSRRLKEKQEVYQQISGEVSAVLEDAIEGQLEIKAFGLKERIKVKYDFLIQKSIQKKFEMARVDSILEAISITASIGIQIGTVFLCLIFVLRNEMTIGELIIFQQIQEMIRNLFEIKFMEFSKSEAALSRIIELWEEEKETVGGWTAMGGMEASGDTLVSFRSVSFNYRSHNAETVGKERRVLKDISFDIREGERVALVGASGSGKSTIIKLICGFLRPDAGEVLFRGRSVEEWDKRALRKHIALVEQNSYLFPVSFFDNIACVEYGDSSGDRNAADLERKVQQSAERAALASFIESLESGYGTMVGERGVKLSGGQRQRLSIARAFMKNAEFLILDEPTSALDAEIEREIQQNLDELGKDRTTLIVAHRLSTVKRADKIIVLHKGEIVESGTHEELIAHKGYFYRLYQNQFLESGVKLHGA